MSKREPMSSIDTAWLRMDRPTNRMIVVGVMALDGALPVERFKQIIASRFLGHRRFRQRAVLDGDTAYWERDPNFDLSFHVKRTALPRPAGKAELYDLVSDLASTALDPARPLWQFHLVDEYQGGSALIARIHHCYADGIALVKVLLSMTDDAAARSDPQSEAGDGVEADLLERWVVAPVANTVTTTLKVGSALLGAYFDVILHPSHALDYARQGVDLTAEAARLALMPNDSPTRFKGTPTGVKRVAWTDRIPLLELKAVAEATGCSINDVVLSCTAGALHSYLLDQGDPVDGVELRALVPVNMRPEGKADSLGNYFGLVAVLLPLGIENPLERLYEIRRRMLDLKSSSQALVTLGLLAAVGMGPNAVQHEILDLLANRASAVLTNVPGPQRPLYMAGAKIKEVVFWVPQSGRIGMGISVLSYDGGLQFGIVIDHNLIDDPESIAHRFVQQFEQLLWVTLLGSWGSAPGPDERNALSKRKR